jgi:hypothetical protein
MSQPAAEPTRDEALPDETRRPWERDDVDHRNDRNGDLAEVSTPTSGETLGEFLARMGPPKAEPDFPTREVEPPYRKSWTMKLGKPFQPLPREATAIDRALAAVDRRPRNFEGLR